MKNFFKLFGIIALAAVIGFSMSACGGDDGGGGGGDTTTTGSKTLVITDIPSTYIQSMNTSTRGHIGVFTAGTSIEDVKAQKGLVAWAEADSGNLSPNPTVNTTGPYTGTYSLLNLADNKAWTGSGKYDVYAGVLSRTGWHYISAYRASVTFSANTTSVTFSNFTDISSQL